MRLSSRRLNVTRFGVATAAAGRAAARGSLGSVSSEIKLMAPLPSFTRHDCADRAASQGAVFQHPRSESAAWRAKGRHGIVSPIIMPPHFRPRGALLGCDKTH